MIVNCGGPGDSSFYGGTPYDAQHVVDVSGLPDPVPEGFYESCRYGANATAFAYVLSGLTPYATYALRLHFAEPYWTHAGGRVFNAFTDDATFAVVDAFALAEAQFKAVAVARTTVASAGGTVSLRFQPIAGDPMVSAIELALVPSLPPAPRNPSPPEELAWDLFASGAVASARADLTSVSDAEKFERDLAVQSARVADLILAERRKRFLS